MTLASAVARVDYIGTGSAGPFAIPFRFFTFADLSVIVRTPSGTETTLVNGIDYTGTGERNTSGTLTLSDVLAIGDTLTILRAPALTQTTSLRNQSSYFGSSHEDALDRLVMQVQALQDQVDRSIGLSPSYSPNDYVTSIAPENGKALVWNESQLTNATLDGNATAIPGNNRQVASFSAYAANNAKFNIADYYLPADGATYDLAIARAVTAMNTAGRGTLEIPDGVFSTGDTVSLDLPDGAHIEWRGLLRSSVSAKVAVRIGATAATRYWYTMSGGINLERTSIDSAGSSTGVEFRNVSNGKFAIKRVYGFYENVLVNGTVSTGCAYNQFQLGWMIDGVSTLRCTASGAGFCNEMTFWGGSWSRTSSFPNGSLATCNLTVDHSLGANTLNNLRFINPSFEDNSLLAKAAFIDGEFIQIVHPRLENTARPNDYPIEFGSHSQECEIIGRGAGLNFASIVDGGIANSYVTRRGVRYRSFGADVAQAIVDVSSDITSSAYAFQSRDTGGTARFWVRCDGIGFFQEYVHAEKGIRFGAAGDASTFNQRGLFWFAGNPNTNVTARIGSICMNLGGGAASTLWIKETGDNTNTGWVAK